MRQIHTFEEDYLEALPSHRSASPHSRKLFVEQLIFPQRVLGYKTHLLEIYTPPTILTPRFLYLCYSLKPTARGEWLGHISGRWRGFLQGIDQKLKAGGAFRGVSTKSRRQSGINVFQDTSPKAGGTFCGVLAKSRRLSGAALFLAIAAGYLGSLAVGGKRQREADGRKHFSGVYLRRLAELFAGDRPKAEGSLEPHFFKLSQRAAWEASRSVWKGSRKLSDLNIFSGYISEGWKGFLLRIDPKPKAVLSRTFSGHRSGPPGEPRGRCGKAAEGSPA